MNVVAWIFAVVLAFVFAAAGVVKITDRVREDRIRFGYSKRQYQLLGVAEVAAAAGVIIGVASRPVEWIGHAAAIGICVTMVGALIVHARVEDDTKDIIPALAMLATAILYIVFLAIR